MKELVLYGKRKDRAEDWHEEVLLTNATPEKIERLLGCRNGLNCSTQAIRMISITDGGNMYYVTMTINGQDVPSSAVARGTLKHCERVASRLNRVRHPSVKWIVKPQAN